MKWCCSLKVIKIERKKLGAILYFEEGYPLFVDFKVIDNNNIEVFAECELAKILSDNEDFAYSYGMEVALNYLSYAMRTESQIAKHLKRKYIQKSASERILEKLKEYRYADDGRYCEQYVSSKVSSGYGRNYIYNKLKQKDIGQEDLTLAFSSYNADIDRENLRELIGKQNESLKKFPPALRMEKIYRRCIAKGFSEGVSELIKEIMAEDESSVYDEYYISLIDKKAGQLIKKGTESSALRQKLYSAFIPKGASRELINQRIDILLSEEV